MVKITLVSTIIAGSCLLLGACNDSKNSKDPVAEGKSTNTTLGDTSNAKVLPLSEQNISKLQYGVKPGEKYQYKMTQKTFVDQDSIHAETEIVMFYTKTVKSVRSDGSMEVAVRFDSIRASNKLPDFASGGKTFKEIKYNSSDSSDRKNLQFTSYNILIGEDVTMTVSPKGTIDEVSGLSPIVSKALGVQRDSVTAQQKAQIAEQIKQEAYIRNLQPEYQIFPDTTIDSNRSWTKTSSIPLFGIFPTKNTVKYTVNSVKEIGGRKALDISMKVDAMVTNRKFKNGPAEFTLNDHEIATSGSSILDLEKGYTIFKRMNVMTYADATAMNIQNKQSQRSKQRQSMITTIELIR